MTSSGEEAPKKASAQARKGTGRKGADAVRRHQFRTLLTLLPYLWPPGRRDIRNRVVLAVMALALAKVATVYVPILYKQAVDALDKGGGGEAAVLAVPVGLIVAYGTVRLASSLFQELREALFARVTQNAIRNAALNTFRHLHGLSLRYHLERQTGGLSRVIERGVKGIEFLLSFTLFNILPTLIEIVLVCGILWSMLDWRFAAATFLTIAGYIAYTLVVTEWRLKFRRAMNDKDSEANTKAIDSLLNYETVKYFGAEGHESARFDRSMRGYEEAAVRSITSLAAVNIGQGGIIAVGLVAVMLMAADGVVSGAMSLGDFVLVNTYLIQLYLPLNFLGFVYRQIRQSLTDMEDMFSILRIEREVEDGPGAGALAIAGGAVRFEGVVFGYDPRRPILKGVDFHVPAGRTLAIVGPSGAGKSTISRLLFRFYDVQAGRVTIDGQDIRDATQASVRAAIGIVPQDTVLFNDTIRYNIAYGRQGADFAAVERAARLARIDRFIEDLPDGYDTMVGERGLKLSGGEKQRVAIARTILKNPAILLFDEATSALDTATERDIQQSLRTVSEGRTTLIIAHRLSTVVDADEIIVLSEGVVAERGRHADLLAADGPYARMWRRQQRVEG
ncbi:ABC transporter ATP-binding protein/permease [Marivibrio halodurans]|uniref:ABC transporter ATP-binding protein/permease n=1 Tax=Marivibrio halodurans TaxID=2039722 RepID=A0A8J7SJ50_9PROT|nr:ABC transporter ATP-binding protein/permease [Marivibrio halodurans]MBP5855438.1 ABC transporter ATP-binding protein/permease [Marivibrio halodurans]